MDYEEIINNPNVCIVGLGYVGLPLAVEFGKLHKVIGFDVNKKRIEELKNKIDRNKETTTEDFESTDIDFTLNETAIKGANVIIITVPTPLKENHIPDIDILKSATKTIGRNLQKNSIVILESTVYPGTTRDICLPILEKESGLKLGEDFGIGYSPERINPGDKEHTIKKVIKIVAGHDKQCLNTVATLYNTIVEAGVFKASTIEVAEAAKIMENTQRAVNIGLMNEFALIFEKMNINTYDVIDATNTKWNALNFYPGLVGGHCIGVDPYYLAHKAREVGYEPEVILTGKETNEFMPLHIVKKVLTELAKEGKMSQKKVLVMGLTFKENIPDTRNSKAKKVIQLLKEGGCQVYCYDPIVNNRRIEKECEAKEIDLQSTKERFDAVIIINKNKEFEKSKERILEVLSGQKIVMDLKKMFPELKEKTRYMTL